MSDKEVKERIHTSHTGDLWVLMQILGKALEITRISDQDILTTDVRKQHHVNRQGKDVIQRDHRENGFLT